METKTTCFILLAVMISTLTGCASPKGSTIWDKRAYTQDMRSEALRQLYSYEPGARDEIAMAPGYGVFEAVQSQFLITGTGNAYGIVRDNRTNQDTHMSAFSAGAMYGQAWSDF